MIVWRGWGILVIGYAFAGLLVGAIAAIPFGSTTWQLVVIGIFEILAAVALWFTGVRFSGPGRQLVDPKTGQQVVFRPRHDLFWIPMQYWAPVLALIGVVVLISGFLK